MKITIETDVDMENKKGEKFKGIQINYNLNGLGDGFVMNRIQGTMSDKECFDFAIKDLTKRYDNFESEIEDVKRFKESHSSIHSEEFQVT